MKNKEGFALIFALLVMVVVGVLVTGSIFNSLVTQTIARNDSSTFTAQNFADAGLSRFKTLAYQNFDFYSRNFHRYDLTEEQWARASCGNFLGVGIDLDLVPNAQGRYTVDILTGQDFTVPVTLPDGTQGGYVVRLSTDGTLLYSTGFIGSSLATARSRSATATRFNVRGGSVWDNALAARGQGAGTRAINGNVTVFGSVHILDDTLTSSQNALELGGGASVFNSYVGRMTGATDVQELMRRVTGGTATDLCAKVKARSGNVSLGTSANYLGHPSSKLKAVELGNGTVMGVEVHVEEPIPAPYTDQSVNMPTLAATYPNEVRPLASVIDGRLCPNWLSTDATQFVIPPRNQPNTACTNATGTARISWTTQSKSFTFERFVNGAWVTATENDPAHPRGAVTLNTHGLSLMIHDAQGSNIIEYTGKGTIRSGSGPNDTTTSLQVTGSLLPLCEANVTPCNRGFPNRNTLGLVSSGNMRLGTNAQSNIAAIAFARGSASIEMQTNVIGSVIADTFDLGQQVPSIMYDTRVKSNLLTALPGSDLGEGGPKLGVVTVDVGVLSP